VKKLNKDYSSMDNTVEAYACGCNCPCTSCSCSSGCGTSGTANYYATNGVTNNEHNSPYATPTGSPYA
jgi:putative bacteriocin precursor